MVCALALFPETVSYGWLNGFAAAIGDIKAVLEMQETILGDKIDWAGTPATKRKSTVATAVEHLNGLVAQLGLLELEFSHGRFSASDLKGLLDPARRLFVRSFTLFSFTDIAFEIHSADEKEEEPSEKGNDEKKQCLQRVYEGLSVFTSLRARAAWSSLSLTAA